MKKQALIAANKLLKQAFTIAKLGIPGNEDIPKLV